jgi:hypothetical protein
LKLGINVCKNVPMKTTITFLSLWFALSCYSVKAQTNNDPTIDQVTDQSAVEDDEEQSIVLTGISDGDDGSQKLTLEVTTDKPDFFSVLELNYGSDTTLVYQVAADSCGVADIKVVVSDDQGASTSISFSVNVECVNDKPTIDQVDDVLLDHNPGTYTVTLTGLTAGPPNEPQGLTLTNTWDTNKISEVRVGTYDNETKMIDLYVDFKDDASGTAFVQVKPFDSDNAFANMIFYITIDIPASIDQPLKDKLNVYPNPVSDVLNVTLPEGAKELNYEIYSLNGKKVLSGSREGRAFQVPVSRLTAGWYQIRIISAGKVYTGKFLVK